jgi:hypothetical protein
MFIHYRLERHDGFIHLAFRLQDADFSGRRTKCLFNLLIAHQFNLFPRAIQQLCARRIEIDFLGSRYRPSGFGAKCIRRWCTSFGSQD